MEEPKKFIADVHVGRLARGLRMLGFDVLYRNNFTCVELKRLAAGQNRVLLSRNVLFQKEPAIQFFLLTSEDWLVQLQQVVEACGLSKKFRPFSRCLICNGLLRSVSKEEVATQLEENTRNFFNAFWQCENCKRVYWKGSHYERMEKVILKLGKQNEAP